MMHQNIVGDDFFGFSNAAWIILATNGSLSAASSILIMSIILRSSPEARTSAYHIIMFFMSFWDVIMSVALSLHTIPMPSDVHEIYPFAGTALGNGGTCAAQGFLIESGMDFILVSIVTLNLYYVLTIRYGMTEERFKKRVMPVMLVLSMTFVYISPVTALKMDIINPSQFTAVCSIDPIVSICTDNNEGGEQDATDNNGAECIQGGALSKSRVLVGVVLAVMVISLVLVILSVFEAELKIGRSKRSQRTLRLINTLARDNRNEQEMHDFQRTRAVMIQALMYISAYLLAYVFASVTLSKLPKYASGESQPSNILTFLTIFFFPLQGFFNAMIFIYLKAHTLRLTKADLTLIGAFKQVILTPSSVPEQVISSIEVAIADIDARRQENTRTHRGQSSVSLRERVLANNGFGLRRFGSHVQRSNIDDDNEEDVNGDVSSSDPVGFNGGDDSASSLCFSGGISLREVLGPGDDDDDDDDDDDLIAIGGGRGETDFSDSSPLRNKEDISYNSMGSTSLDLGTNIMFSAIAEEEDECGDDGSGLNEMTES